MATIATNATFDELLKDEKLVIVDFWAVWCGPCRMIAPILDQISEEMADKVSVVKCNVDDCEDVAMRYRIMNIPTLLFFKNGEMVDRTVGAMPKAALVEKIESLL
ncbi:MAG: thioredoxin [Bacteroidales bacterium]|nr:thioredoxin [Bacteroidales bacterium]